MHDIPKVDDLKVSWDESIYKIIHKNVISKVTTMT